MDNLKLRVALGWQKDWSIVRKFGRNSAMDIASPEDIWDGGGTYVYPTVADYVYLSSSSSSDAGLSVTVQGLDENWDKVSEVVILDGTDPTSTAVSTTNKFIRVFRMFNSDVVDFTGTVYCGSTSTIASGVPAGDTYAIISLIDGESANQTLMAIYTIPNDYYGLVMRWDIDNSNDRESTAGFFAREYGKVFRNKKVHGIYRNFLPVDMDMLLLKPKTDIKIRGQATVNPTRMSSTFTLYLIPKSQVDV